MSSLKSSLSVRALGCAVFLLVVGVGAVQGQALRGQVGLQMSGSSVQKSLAPGLHLSALWPITGGLSLTGGAGLSAFLLEGRRGGTYTFEPRASLRITLPSRSTGANALFGGAGYHLPVQGPGADAGPTVHLGVGRIWTLRESTLFVDLSPTVLLRDQTTAFLMPLRAGIVF